MRTILLMTGCLTALYSISTAQVVNAVQTDANQTAVANRLITESTASTPSGNDYASLNNTPYFPGGQQALQAYFGNPALFPDRNRISAANGVVKIQFRVLADGHLSELQIVESGGPVLDRAVLAAVSVMPRWYPAHRAGVAVSSLYLLPVRFDGIAREVANR